MMQLILKSDARENLKTWLLTLLKEADFTIEDLVECYILAFENAHVPTNDFTKNGSVILKLPNMRKDDKQLIYKLMGYMIEDPYNMIGGGKSTESDAKETEKECEHFNEISRKDFIAHHSKKETKYENTINLKPLSF